MSALSVPWCCASFQANFGLEFETAVIDGLFRDRRGMFVDCRRSPAGPLFVLVCRSVSVENRSSVARTDVPISLETEIGIRCCPWCGVDLGRHYGRHIEDLPNPT